MTVLVASSSAAVSKAAVPTAAVSTAAVPTAALFLAAVVLTSATAAAQSPAPPTEPAASAPSSAPPKPLAPNPAPSDPASPPAEAAAPAEGEPAASAVASDPAHPPSAASDASQAATPAAAPASGAEGPAASPSTEPAPSAAPARPSEDPVVDNPLVVDRRSKRTAPDTPRVDAWLGVHGLIVSSPGYDAFSEDDALTSFGAGVGAELGAVGGGRLAAVAGLSLGGGDASYRGQHSELSVVRMTLGPELRFPFAGRFFAYGRLSPELLHFTAELADDSSTTTLEQGKWLFGIDTALGIAMRLADLRPQGMTAPLSLFARIEAGYAWSPETELSLWPEGSNGPIRSEPLALDELSLSGVSFRVAIGVGY